MSEFATPVPAPTPRGWLRALGPGLVTGAADDDPSGIATYSQVGAQFGYGLCWVMLFSYPLMAVIQLVSAEIGCVTGRGIAQICAGTIRAGCCAPPCCRCWWPISPISAPIWAPWATRRGC